MVGAEYDAWREAATRTAAARPPEASSAPTDALAAISYTGGTTGRPKGVMLSHGNLLANARHNIMATGHAAEDRWLHVCPMFHVAGTANVVAATWVGAYQVVLPRFDAAAVLAAIESYKITHLVLVPTMLGMLLDHPDLDTADLSSLVHVQYAASPITPELQRRVLAALPGHRRRAVLRDDRGRADRHDLHARRPPPRRRRAPGLDGRAGDRRRGRGPRPGDDATPTARRDRRGLGPRPQHHVGVLGAAGGHAAPR